MNHVKANSRRQAEEKLGIGIAWSDLNRQLKLLLVLSANIDIEKWLKFKVGEDKFVRSQAFGF